MDKKIKDKDVEIVNSPEMFAPKAKVIDERKKNFYIIDNIFIDRYAKFVKASGIVVYNALQRHSNKNIAFPGVRHLAEETDTSNGFIAKGINFLHKYKIIAIKKDKKGTRNIYTLKDKDEWLQVSEKTWSNQSKKKEKSE